MKRAILPSEGTTLKHRPRIVLPPIALDRHSTQPLYLQLGDALRRTMSRGDLPAGARLPSTRALARHLGVSRNTVLCAYEELAAEGRLAARVGSGTCVGVSTRVRRPNTRQFLREAQYPVDASAFRDPDGNALYFHR